MAALALAGCGAGQPEQDGMERLRSQVARGDTAAAQLTLDQLQERGTPRSEYAALAGEAALARGELAEARRWLGDGAFSRDTAGLGFRLLAQLAMREGKPDEAANALEMALKSDPADPEVWVDIGRLRYRLGNHIAALEAAERAIELGPGNVQALRFRGQLARDSEGVAPAAAWFARARESEPWDEGLRLEHAAALLDAGEIEPARALLYEREIYLPQAHYLKAVAAARGGDFGDAREALDRSGPTRERSAAARMLSAIIDVERGALESAAQTLDQLAREQPDNRRAHELLAYVLMRNGNEDELVYRYADAARGPWGSVWMRTLVGRALEALDRRDEAAVFLDLAPTRSGRLEYLPPTGVGGSGALARRDEIRARLGVGDSAAALRAARSFAGEFPGSSDAAAMLGDALLAAGQAREARAAYAKSARVRQSWPLVLRMSSTLPKDEASRLIVQFAAANPMNAEAAALAAEAYATAGRWDRAAAALDRSLANGMRRVPWVLAARSVAAGRLDEGDGRAQLDWALEAYEVQRMDPAAMSALLGALPPGDEAMRSNLRTKLAALADR